MRKLITVFFLIFVISGSGAFAQQISDDQVVEYAKEARIQGKNAQEIVTELLMRGATREQLERIKEKYEESQESGIQKPIINNDIDRLRSKSNIESKSSAKSNNMNKYNSFKTFKKGAILNKSESIFGREIFSNENLSFEPNSNIATPVNYRLGPGDEVIIDIWGTSENTIRKVISPEGAILIANLGPLYLSGMTINEATKYVCKELSKIYSGLSEDSSQLKLSLGKIRSIQINIMGEVAVPGTYTLSSFSSVFHALYCAGGINSIGGMRNIQVIRGGKSVANIDVYDYIMQGKTKDDIRLMEDDVILVKPYEYMVSISGNVKRPLSYEMKKGETIADLLKFSGGFLGNAYTQSIRLIRLSGREKQIYNVDEMEYATFKLCDADSLTVEAVLDRFENMVEVRGAVYRDGLYQINNGVNTIKQLIKKAEGLRGDAFLNRAQLKREHEDLTIEIIPIDLKGMLAGSIADFPLQRNDVLYIPSIHDLEEKKSLVIHGEVANPGVYDFAKNMTIEDLILLAGGLKEAAATVHIDVSRRIKDPESTQSINTVSDTFSFEFKDGYIIDGKENFYLEPFDEVYIRKSPVYFVQQNVTIVGEVVYSGNYTLLKKNERLIDLITRSGGVTPNAYIKGARLMRKMTAEEMRRMDDVVHMTKTSESHSLNALDLSTTYFVGIDLERAITNPNSDFNVVLREGDVLIIPEYNSTVKVNGAVMYPNTVSYKEGKNFKYYLDQAGGYGNLARKNKSYIVYMNGTVAKLKKCNSKQIEPGCEIFIPKNEAKKKMTTMEALSIGTSIASFATVIAALANIFK